MRFAVCVKHSVDESELRIDSEGRPQLDGTPAKLGTFDKNAVEEALRLKTAHGGDVVAITVGMTEARKSLKEALAMGADRGIHVLAELRALDPSRTSELLAAAITKTGPYDLIICSEGSSDTYTGLVPPMIAERLGLPYVGYAKKLDIFDHGINAERSLEESFESVESTLPSVVSVVSEINEPRYPTLIQIMQSSKKPIEEIRSEQLVTSGQPHPATIISMVAQSPSRKRVIIEGAPNEAAEKLLSVLEKEGVLSI